MVKSSPLNWLINNLPFELHLPGYNYCGPGTNLKKRLERRDKGINLLDEYCKQHDIAYISAIDLNDRHKADIKLLKMARTRIQAPNATPGEKLAAHLVNKAMLAKVCSGAGYKKINKDGVKTVGVKKHFKNIVHHTKKKLKKLKPKCKELAIELAMAAAREIAENSSIKVPRIIPVPKTGGVLPLIPIFAGLSAAGSLAGGVATIKKMINDFKAAKQRLTELKRHNEKMEALCIGNGLKLKHHNKGLGIIVSNKKN